jgi:hypothetical protein
MQNGYRVDTVPLNNPNPNREQTRVGRLTAAVGHKQTHFPYLAKREAFPFSLRAAFFINTQPT